MSGQLRHDPFAGCYCLFSGIKCFIPSLSFSFSFAYENNGIIGKYRTEWNGFDGWEDEQCVRKIIKSIDFLPFFLFVSFFFVSGNNNRESCKENRRTRTSSRRRRPTKFFFCDLDCCLTWHIELMIRIFRLFFLLNRHRKYEKWIFWKKCPEALGSTSFDSFVECSGSMHEKWIFSTSTCDIKLFHFS